MRFRVTSSVSRLLAGLAFALLSGGATAQQAVDPTLFEVPAGQVAPTFLTVDIDQMFTQSQFGQRIGQSYTHGREELATENGRIAQALREEELALAAQRSEMDVAVFREEALAFDEKAQAIRRAQDAKERALEETLSLGRDQFLSATRPILGELMVERGAVAILDRRSVLLSLGSIDVTDAAIARIDATIGDGSQLTPDTTTEDIPEN
ncbi:OmpH family outer membrane protein [Octadecabacter ascidiaceicola]|uniref:Outer membrane protein (OmpH-like) n=1 Tax=Octadecabacter ascidiaceicola TaxID=1655543 RepID=A0A238JK76_9RHOB|nr:OmpH family outer membrane protein [Octadecabacter ascidiaceicola]SMX31069.1 Outer membrane protein (OmpH-like) [Octadecabacter ascidiaceicola]